MTWKNRLEMTATLVMCLSSVAIAGAVGWRTFGPPPKPKSAEPVAIDGWRQYSTGQKVIGPNRAPVTLVEFSDFQCPFCGQLSRRLLKIRQQYPTEVRVVYRNMPIETLHPYARDAALAGECAAYQGHFTAYHDSLFAHQDKIGVTRWAQLAAEVGVADTTAFTKCMGSAVAVAQLRADSLAAVNLGVTGTPTLLVNQWRIEGAPTEVQLRAMIAKELNRGR